MHGSGKINTSINYYFIVFKNDLNNIEANPKIITSETLDPLQLTMLHYVKMMYNACAYI